MKLNCSISDILRPLDEAPHQAYLSAALQVPDLIEWITEQFGPSNLYQTSFSISEEYLRRIYNIRRKGMIKDIMLIMDRKATNKIIKLWVFISQVVEHVYLSDNHSKIILIKSAEGKTATVITSQNLTRGNRLESACITTDKSVFDNILNSFNDTIKNKSIPFSDLFNSKIQSFVNIPSL